MEQRDGEMKGGGREARGGVGEREKERERSCQGNVYPCHSSQKSAMDEWITAISDCQGASSVRFDVFCGQNGSSRNRMHKSPLLRSRSSSPHFHVFLCMRLDCVHRNAPFVQSLEYCSLCTNTHTHTHTGKFPVRPCRQSFRAIAAGSLCVCE